MSERTKVIAITTPAWIQNATNALPVYTRVDEALQSIMVRFGTGDYAVVSATEYRAFNAAEVIARSLGRGIFVHIDESLGSSEDVRSAWAFILDHMAEYIFVVVEHSDVLLGSAPAEAEGKTLITLEGENGVLSTGNTFPLFHY